MQETQSKIYSELYIVLNILGEDYISKLPDKLYDLIDNLRDKDYNPNMLSNDGYLDESLISKETIALFAVLNTKYFMEDNDEKKEYFKILNENEIHHQKELQEKYNIDNFFNNKIENFKNDSSNYQTQLVKYEEVKWYKKIFTKILKIFRK